MISYVAGGLIAGILAFLVKDNMCSVKKSANIYLDPQEETNAAPLSETEINLLKSSWEKVVPIKEQAAELFYGRLFELEPEVQSLFKGDMKQQGDKLMLSLSTVVNSVDKLEEVVPVLEDMAKRHVEYGVVSEHYQIVGAAFLWTLEQGLGEDFTEETKQAWTKAYGLISATMIAAAYP